MTDRCAWCGTDPLYVAYHDSEWGVPEYSSRDLWEKLVLDGFQAGLSWITILRKRDAFRDVFEGFDPQRVALWNSENIDNAMQNPGIVRHRGKIESTVRSARLYLEIESQEGFSHFLWQFVGGQPIINAWPTDACVPTRTAQSDAMSKALRQRGFNYCGPVICYAFMEATGMVNDHIATCPRHRDVTALSVP